MPLRLEPFAHLSLDESLLRLLLNEHERFVRPRFRRLWDYYRNPSTPRPADPAIPAAAARPRLAQEQGLPPRLRGRRDPRADDRDDAKPEVVIENDIAWRLHALVDFMLPRPPALLSTASDPQTRNDIQRILDAVFEASGGISLLQDAALLGSIFGHTDLLLRADDLFTAMRNRNADQSDADLAVRLADRLRIELIEPPRAVPLLNAADFRDLDAYIIAFERELNRASAPSGRGAGGEGFLNRTLASLRARISSRSDRRDAIDTLEIHSAARRQRYENERLVEDEPNPLGVLPVVHIQNLSQPFHYEGLSDVEPLIPLQDELNTRLSDRAHRVTLQSFKMYLAKGLEGFGEQGAAPIAPGQVWSTDNPDASVEAFGGDADSPSEDSHIQQVREAMDKTSAVNPLAAGLLRAKVGQLSSENALRITLMGTLAKTARKQVTFGRGLVELAQLILRAFDIAGVYRTDPAERGVRVQWPEALPRQENQRLEAARAKVELGVPRQRVLAELGYAPTDAGIT